jgi:repressor LexA
VGQLTARQQDVLVYIQTYQQEHGKAPLLREIAKGLGLGSYRSLTKYVRVLKERGFLEKSRGWRAWQAVREAVSLPFLGTIRAGVPQVEEIGEAAQVRVPKAALTGVRRPDRCYILRVSGDSMSPAFESGELVLVDQDRLPRDGDVVVALVDESENTLKTLRRSTAGEWILWAENAAYPPIVAKDMRRLQVQGVVVRKLSLG